MAEKHAHFVTRLHPAGSLSFALRVIGRASVYTLSGQVLACITAATLGAIHTSISLLDQYTLPAAIAADLAYDVAGMPAAPFVWPLPPPSENPASWNPAELGEFEAWVAVCTALLALFALAASGTLTPAQARCLGQGGGHRLYCRSTNGLGPAEPFGPSVKHYEE